MAVVPLNRLEIRVEPGESADHPRVVLLVDGQDVLAWRGDQGFGPESLLHTGDPLLPADPPRRVALYLCGCGIPGCGTVSCVISESDGVVRWSRFLDITGLNSPLDTSVPEEYGRPVDVADLTFDAAAYRAEVERAKADRSWETPRRRRARLLKARLAAEPERWDQLGVRFRSVWLWDADNDVYAVNLDRQGDQLVIGVRAPRAAAEETALDRMAAEVLAGDERSWFVIYDQRDPSPARDLPDL